MGTVKNYVKLINGENNWEPVRPLRTLPENHLESESTLITNNNYVQFFTVIVSGFQWFPVVFGKQAKRVG